MPLADCAACEGLQLAALYVLMLQQLHAADKCKVM